MSMTPYTGETLTIANIGTTPQERAMETPEFKMAFSKDFHEFVEWFNETHNGEIDEHMADSATEEKLGHVIVDGETILVDENGVISSAVIPSGALTNKNLLHNWDFRNPVNQRGQSSYSGINIYSIDRWQVENGVTLIVNDGYITLENASGTTNAIRQDLEQGHIFNGKTLTLSVCIKGVYRINLYRIPSGGGAINLGGNTGTAVDWEVRTVTVTVSGLEYLDKLRVYIRCEQSGGSVLVQSAKLELGSVSTLANDPPADYQEQLSLCKPVISTVAPTNYLGNDGQWQVY